MPSPPYRVRVTIELIPDDRIFKMGEAPDIPVSVRLMDAGYTKHHSLTVATPRVSVDLVSDATGISIGKNFRI